MKKSTKKIASLLLAILVLLQFSTTCFALDEQQSLNDTLISLSVTDRQIVLEAIYTSNYVNLSNFSDEEQAMISSVTLNPNRFLKIGSVYDGKPVLVFNTPNSNTQIAITNGYIEIVERLGVDTFSINGVTTKAWIGAPHSSVVLSSTDTPTPNRDVSGWIETSYLDKQWSYYDSYWRDIYTENAFYSYTVGVLAAIIAALVPQLAGFAISIAGMLIASIYSNTSIAWLYCVEYIDTVSGAPVLWYKKQSCHAYAEYHNERQYLGYEIKYYFMNLM